MTRSKKLKPVVKHVEDREQDALQGVAFSQRRLTEHETRLKQLIEYRLEYINRHVSETGSVNAVAFQEYHRFMSQLDDTIKQQQQVVELAVKELEVKRKHWQLSRTKSDAIHMMVDRIQKSELQEEERVEQKLMDEAALRAVAKKH